MSASRKRSAKRTEVKKTQFEQAQEAYRESRSRSESLQIDIANFRVPIPKFNYAESTYNTSALLSGSLSITNARKEYSKLRSVAKKRLERMEKAGFKDTETYKDYAKAFPVLSGLNESEVYYKLGLVSKFLRSPLSSTKYQKLRRERTQEAFKEHEYAMQMREFEEGTRTKFEDYSDFVKTKAFFTFLELLQAAADDKALYHMLKRLEYQLGKRHITVMQVLRDKKISVADEHGVVTKDQIRVALEGWLDKSGQEVDEKIHDMYKDSTTKSGQKLSAQAKARLQHYGVKIE